MKCSRCFHKFYSDSKSPKMTKLVTLMELMKIPRQNNQIDSLFSKSDTTQSLVSSLHSKIQTSSGRSKINYQIVMSRLKLLFRACKAWVQSAATGGSPDCDERVHAMRLHTHCTFNVTFPFGMGSSTTATETARRRSFYDVGVDKVRVVDNPTKLLSRHSVCSGKVRETGHSNQTDE